MIKTAPVPQERGHRVLHVVLQGLHHGPAGGLDPGGGHGVQLVSGHQAQDHIVLDCHQGVGGHDADPLLPVHMGGEVGADGLGIGTLLQLHNGQGVGGGHHHGGALGGIGDAGVGAQAQGVGEILILGHGADGEGIGGVNAGAVDDAHQLAEQSFLHLAQDHGLGNILGHLSGELGEGGIHLGEAVPVRLGDLAAEAGGQHGAVGQLDVHGAVGLALGVVLLAVQGGQAGLAQGGGDGIEDAHIQVAQLLDLAHILDIGGAVLVGEGGQGVDAVVVLAQGQGEEGDGALQGGGAGLGRGSGGGGGGSFRGGGGAGGQGQGHQHSQHQGGQFFHGIPPVNLVMVPL